MEADDRTGAMSFNGATAFQPWRRQLHCGMHILVGELQWGHGFSAVETLVEEVNQLNKARLQWGHGFSAVETWAGP